MSTIPSLYSSTDSGAPSLTGQAGSLRDVLRAVLVTGYGTGPSAKPGAGWTEEFTGSNVSAFRNSPVTGTGAYLRIDDSAAVGNARHAWVRAYESMTGIDAGTGPAPTVAQRASGVLVPKSGTLDSTARRWIAFASELFVYLFVDVGNTAAAWLSIPSFPFFAGDILTRTPSDNFNFLLLGDSATSMTSSGGTSSGQFTPGRYEGTPSTNSFLLRGFNQTAGAKAAQLAAYSDGYISGALGGGGTYPDPVSGGLPIERISVFEGARQVRGFLPNVYGATTGISHVDMATVSGLDSLPAGMTLIAKRYHQARGGASFTSTLGGQLYFDLTSDWWS